MYDDDDGDEAIFCYPNLLLYHVGKAGGATMRFLAQTVVRYESGEQAEKSELQLLLQTTVTLVLDNQSIEAAFLVVWGHCVTLFVVV